MATCTWVGCTATAFHEHKDTGGKPWCNLCAAHHARTEEAINHGTPKEMVAVWIKAQGGASKAAKRMGH